MTERNDDDRPDPVVSKAYRSLPSVRAPEAMDDLVLKNAASKAAAGQRWSFTFMNPVGLAAVVLLCFAVFVQLDLGDATTGGDTVLDLAPTAGPATTSRSIPAGGAAESAAATSISAAGARSGAHLRELANDTLTLQTGMPESAGAVADEEPSSACNPAATRHPTDWQQCIDELRRAGRPDLARLEEERLRRLYPAIAGEPE